MTEPMGATGNIGVTGATGNTGVTGEFSASLQGEVEPGSTDSLYLPDTLYIFRNIRYREGRGITGGGISDLLYLEEIGLYLIIFKINVQGATNLTAKYIAVEVDGKELTDIAFPIVPDVFSTYTFMIETIKAHTGVEFRCKGGGFFFKPLNPQSIVHTIRTSIQIRQLTFFLTQYLLVEAKQTFGVFSITIYRTS